MSDLSRLSRLSRLPREGLQLLAAGSAALLLAGCVVAPVGPGGPRYAHRAPPPPAAAPAGPAMYFYPERGQDAARQDRDRYECYRWAAHETSFDPGMTPTSAPPRMAGPPPPNGANVIGGAATGAVIGAIAAPGRSAGEGAVIGAIFGTLLGAAAEQNQQYAYESAAARNAQMQASARVPMDDFRRAMSACMGGRGYRVN